MHKLVLIRHGESLWNKENRFTGWKDVGLSEEGLAEATRAGEMIQKAGLQFDIAYTSVLKRAIKTLWTVLEETDQMFLPVEKAWQLNERHYGGLTGLNKKETAEKHGEDQVFIWRRSFATPPPSLNLEDPEHPSHDRRYAHVKDLVPSAEALKHCKDRVMPYWENVIKPSIQSGQRVIVAAHGNSLRALIMHLDQISEEEISQLNVPTGIPLVYELDPKLQPIQSYYLGDEEEARKKAKAVAEQAK